VAGFCSPKPNSFWSLLLRRTSDIDKSINLNSLHLVIGIGAPLFFPSLPFPPLPSIRLKNSSLGQISEGKVTNFFNCS